MTSESMFTVAVSGNAAEGEQIVHQEPAPAVVKVVAIDRANQFPATLKGPPTKVDEGKLHREEHRPRKQMGQKERCKRQQEHAQCKAAKPPLRGQLPCLHLPGLWGLLDQCLIASCFLQRYQEEEQQAVI
eukprot:CAMPEP_0179076934 /NCGR_PEP_ID=MMETSP0796-20121207/34358_1 /TAXON_ID=73915 /ORGANISM="Pyrodinium bahamense, Strain pbaha01" /LENGTH=129 /DNA_ID=CAMNT_0020774205 /DNA_START=181 /DNA_END=569 /DNA_ORIENTATION=-